MSHVTSASEPDWEEVNATQSTARNPISIFNEKLPANVLRYMNDKLVSDKFPDTNCSECVNYSEKLEPERFDNRQLRQQLAELTAGHVIDRCNLRTNLQNTFIAEKEKMQRIHANERDALQTQLLYVTKALDATASKLSAAMRTAASNAERNATLGDEVALEALRTKHAEELTVINANHHAALNRMSIGQDHIVSTSAAKIKELDDACRAARLSRDAAIEEQQALKKAHKKEIDEYKELMDQQIRTNVQLEETQDRDVHNLEADLVCVKLQNDQCVAALKKELDDVKQQNDALGYTCKQYELTVARYAYAEITTCETTEKEVNKMQDEHARVMFLTKQEHERAVERLTQECADVRERSTRMDTTLRQLRDAHETEKQEMRLASDRDYAHILATLKETETNLHVCKDELKQAREDHALELERAHATGLEQHRVDQLALTREKQQHVSSTRWASSVFVAMAVVIMLLALACVLLDVDRSSCHRAAAHAQPMLETAQVLHAWWRNGTMRAQVIELFNIIES